MADEAQRSTMPGVVFILSDNEADLARIDELGRLFMRDEATGAMVESYDMSRFGRLVYRMATQGKDPPA